MEQAGKPRQGEPALYWEVHDGRGPPLLLVHGFLSSRAQWRPNLAALAEVCRPVVVELWGHGRSPRPPSLWHYTPEGYLAQLERIRAALGVEQWFLGGQSLGASLTLRYALEHPERVLAQFFTNSNSAFADRELVRTRRRDAAAAIRAIEEEGLAAVEALRIHPRHARRLPPEVHEELLADAARIDPAAIADSYRSLNVDATVRERVGANRVPTLLLCGRYEKRFAPHRAFAQAHMPCLRVVELEAGHAVNAQAAEAFNREVVAFLAAHLPPEQRPDRPPGPEPM